MAPKRKADEKAATEPAAKEAKTVEPEEAEPKAAEPDTSEKETDAPADKRPGLKSSIVFKTCDTTLNVVPTMGGKILRSLTDGGMQYLIAGARARTGFKAGRYLFEVKIFESLPVNDAAWQKNAPKPKQLLCVGFSTEGSSLVLGEGNGKGAICFDNEGFFLADGKKTKPAGKLFKDQTIGVLLNLDPKSPNANTISLFRNGQRVTQPQALPESLQGKTLFPHVAYRNVSVQVNFGPQPMAPLPFKCTMAGAAAKEDTVTKPSPEPKDGKYDVLFPVGYPDEGTFEWLDGFLAKNPHYVELSDRKIIDWAVASGVWRPNKWGKGSNDKPAYDFGLAPLDDSSARNVLQAFTPVMPRHYVVMEVRGNLLPTERERVLKRFSNPCFKKTAVVMMGEPPQEFKAIQQEKMLKVKQEKADKAWKVKKAEKERKKAAAERAKKVAQQRKEAEEKRKKLIEEAKKKKEEAEAKKKAEKEGEAKADDAEEKKEEKEEEAKAEEPKKMEVDEGAEKKEEEKKEEEQEKKEEAPEEEDDDMGDEPPPVELTEEEKKQWFSPSWGQDVKDNVMNSSFSNFTIPEKAEGFDDVRFEWQKESAAKSYLREKILEKKKNSKVDTLAPGKFFLEKLAGFKKVFTEWQKKQEEFKNTPAQKAKAAKKAAKKDDDDDEDEAAKVNDIFSVDNVSDIGEGEPLFKDFELADWALLQLRFELWLLQVAFKKDVNDEDRPAIPQGHFSFYYNRYFKKNLMPKPFGVENFEDLLKMVKDTAAWESEHLTTPLTLEDDEDPSIFVKYTEEARRERQRRIDAGDETARLKVQQAALGIPPKPAAPKPAAPKPVLAKPAAPAPALTKPVVAAKAGQEAAKAPTPPKLAAAKPALAKPALAKPAGLTPAKPAGLMPGKPAGLAPAKPAGLAPARPAGALALGKPAGLAPAKPAGALALGKPAGMAPATAKPTLPAKPALPARPAMPKPVGSTTVTPPPAPAAKGAGKTSSKGAASGGGWGSGGGSWGSGGGWGSSGGWGGGGGWGKGGKGKW